MKNKQKDVISKIVMDKNGHIIEMSTKNIYPEINARFFNKEESDARFVNANNALGTEIMEGALTVNKDVEIKGSLKVTKDLLVEGENNSIDKYTISRFYPPKTYLYYQYPQDYKNI